MKPASEAAADRDRSYRSFSRNWRVRLKDCFAHRSLEAHWRACLDAERMSRDALLALQRRRLDALLDHAIRHVPFYRHWARAQGIVPGDSIGLEDLPLTSKSEYKSDPAAFFSEAYDPKRLVLQDTSGSTGQPLIVPKDRRARDYAYACLWRSLRRHGLRPGDRYAYFWGAAALYGQGPLRRQLTRAKGNLRNYLSDRVYVNTADMAPETVRRELDRVERHQPVYLMGYTSGLYVVARQMLEEGRRFQGFRLRAAISEGEQIEEWQAKTMTEAFQCPIVEHYGCVELGFLAGTDPDGYLRFNDDLCVVECLPDGAVALTGLWSEAYPFIRYKVGDLAELRQDVPGPLPFTCLSRVRGRVADLVATPAGGLIGGIEFHAILSLYPEYVRRFQLHQLALDRFVVTLELARPLPDEAREMLLRQLRKLIGGAIEIELKIVDQIGAQASGKFRWIISDVTRNLQRSRSD